MTLLVLQAALVGLASGYFVQRQAGAPAPPSVSEVKRRSIGV